MGDEDAFKSRVPRRPPSHTRLQKGRARPRSRSRSSVRDGPPALSVAALPTPRFPRTFQLTGGWAPLAAGRGTPELGAPGALPFL